jgi:hypothetical protein
LGRQFNFTQGLKNRLFSRAGFTYALQRRWRQSRGQGQKDFINSLFSTEMNRSAQTMQAATIDDTGDFSKSITVVPMMPSFTSVFLIDDNDRYCNWIFVTRNESLSLLQELVDTYRCCSTGFSLWARIPLPGGPEARSG